MTDLDLAALRAAAEAAPDDRRMGGEPLTPEERHALYRFQVAARPAVVVALLDRLEAAERGRDEAREVAGRLYAEHEAATEAGDLVAFATLAGVTTKYATEENDKLTAERDAALAAVEAMRERCVEACDEAGERFRALADRARQEPRFVAMVHEEREIVALQLSDSIRALKVSDG